MQLDPLPFARLMGINVVSVAPDLVVGELKVREDLCTRPAVLHGGAYMAFADTIGAVATVANLKEGETTRRSRARPISSPRFHWATRRAPNAPRCTRAAPPWCGRPGSRAATGASPRW